MATKLSNLLACSHVPAARILPSGEKATHCTHPRCLRKERRLACVDRSQRLTSPPSVPAARVFESGEKATQLTACCSVRRRLRASLRAVTSQKRILLSPPDEASSLPFGDKAMQFTSACSNRHTAFRVLTLMRRIRPS